MYNCYVRVERFDAPAEGQDVYEGRVYLGALTELPDEEGWRQAYYVGLAAGDAIFPGKNNAKRGKAEMTEEEWAKEIAEEVRESGKNLKGEFTGFQYCLLPAA